MKQKVYRVLFLIPGLFIKLYEFAKAGSRDLSNKQRFKKAIIDSGCTLNENTFLHPNSRVLANCVFNNVNLGSYSYVGRNSLLQNVTIGKFCSIANNVMIGLGKHPLDNFSTSPLFYRRNNPLKIRLVNKDKIFVEYEDVFIGNDVWIGAGVIIMDGVKISDGAVIAAGAVVTKDVNSYEIVGGIPAKFLKKRVVSKKNTKTKSDWWDLDLNEIISKAV